MEQTFEEVPEAGKGVLELEPGKPGHRYIKALHMPSQAVWWRCFAAYTYFTQQASGEQIIPMGDKR